MKYIIKDHEIGVDFWNSKEELFRAFYGKFYEFIKSHGGNEDLAKNNIKDVEDFYKFADWYAGGKENCYAMGFEFHKYFLTPEIGGKLENQPDTTFIGWCHKNNLFTDFIDFLITYFAWWRNDEGCTCFNPYNFADDFFAGAWATLVDTCKLFYFTGETVFHWHSFRIKYVCDHIPGVILIHPEKKGDRIYVAGYEFKGWEEENGTPVANFIRKDFYNYWEKEEKKIVKVIGPDSHRPDPR